MPGKAHFRGAVANQPRDAMEFSAGPEILRPRP